MIVQEILTAQSNPQEELDTILAKCCEMVLDGQEQDSEFYGMVGACVVCPDGQLVYGVNYEAEDGTRVHAERAALERCANISPECIVVTTLSPCNRPMDERSGESCEDLLAAHGITHVYCGYKDPSQDSDTSIKTHNPKLQELCKKLADTFLTEISDTTLQNYLSKANQQVDNRLNRMSQARERLNKGYEIYHADRPAGSTQIVDRFEADTPVLAQQYYEKFIHNYESDRDFDLRLRRSTGIMENFDDGKVKGKSRPGRVKRAGASCNGSVTSLRTKAKRASGERAKMYHWCANMKSGKKK